MIYQFICEKCGEVLEVSKPMSEPMPKVFCPACNVEMNRDWVGEQKDKATIIPEHMKATNPAPAFKYDRVNKKQYY